MPDALRAKTHIVHEDEGNETADGGAGVVDAEDDAEDAGATDKMVDFGDEHDHGSDDHHAKVCVRACVRACACIMTLRCAGSMMFCAQARERGATSLLEPADSIHAAPLEASHDEEVQRLARDLQAAQEAAHSHVGGAAVGRGLAHTLNASIAPSGEVLLARTASQAQLTTSEFWKKLDKGAVIHTDL